MVDREQIDERFNRHRLVVNGLAAPRYVLFEGLTELGKFSKEDLAQGIDLVRLPELSTNKRATELRKLVVERHRTINPARLEAVGHVPPRPAEPMPLDEATRRADALETRIQALARPIPVSLILAPTD